MPNKSSPHGGFVTEGTISHGTLRTQDLLRTFAAELDRLMPFNGAKLANEAREAADKLDSGTIDNAADDIYQTLVLSDLIDQLDAIAQREGFYFGTLEGDGSDFGFWRVETDND